MRPRTRWKNLALGGLLVAGLAGGCNSASKQSSCSTCSSYGQQAGQVVMVPVLRPAAPTQVMADPYPSVQTPTAPQSLPPVVEHSPTSVTSTSAKPDDTAAPRRSYADITADARFAHADDYGWLVGEVIYSHARKAWRLRYASIDEVDRYGGSVTLAGRETADLKDGQIVKVEGSLIDPESRDPSPAYRLANVTPLR